MDLDLLRRRCEALGAKPAHVARLMRAWLRGRPLGEAAKARRSPMPRALLECLPALEGALDLLARVVSEHASRDGSTRLLLRLQDGLSVESVLLAREALCVSTQVGCAVGCRFCKSGESGLLRQLAPEEILAQVALARRRARIRRVVLMGMGEPAHNLPAVLRALAWLGGEGGLAHKQLVFSTVGDARTFERLLASGVRPALALSLHTTARALRERLLPRAPREEPAELLERALEYSEAVTWPLQVQWTLLEGVNDGDEEADRLAALLRGRRAIVNYIPFNAVEGITFRRPDWTRCVALVRRLEDAGVRSTLRRSGGQDVDGACGQLRARDLASLGAYQA